MISCGLRTRNGEACDYDELPILDQREFREWVLGRVSESARISALFGVPAPNERTRIIAVAANDLPGELEMAATEVGGSYPALTPECPQLHLFERELAEEWNVVPTGHPWLKPVRFKSGEPGVCDFFRVEGREIHEVAVGPVHAGIIEPGHFRFQCNGENVLHLEIALGYQHRGIERALVRLPVRAIHYAETVAGDTVAGHAMAYCQVMESLSGTEAPFRGQALRAVSLELERMANHTGDLGALAGDVGYLPTASFCGRLRGDYLNMSALLCGSRFGRGMIRPGGVAFDLEKARAEKLANYLDLTLKETACATGLLWETNSVRARFDETGALSADQCVELGLVGVAARACGLERDVRRTFPAGFYRFFQIPVSTYHTGDVFARAYVRWLEIQRSAEFILEQIHAMPEGPIRVEPAPPAPCRIAVSLVEGWRGEICHAAITDVEGDICSYKVVDPSFHNWHGLAMAMRNQQISDFPLCNKSFNLSYCGHDL